MANPSLQIGNDNWAIKEDNLLGYSTAGTRFVPQPITMTRATLGTRVNPSGLVEDVALLGSELVTNGDFPSGTTAWTFGAGWSLGTNKAERLVAASSTDIVQASVFPNLTSTFKISFDVVRSAGSIRLRAGTYSLPYVSATDTYIYYVTPVSNDQLKFQADSSFVGSITNISVKEATIDNLPRVDYTDGTSSLLVEPQRTNLYTDSNNTSTWTNSNFTTTNNYAISPDGTQNAFRGVSTSNASLLYISSTGSAGTNTISIYAKSNTDSDQKFRFFGNGNTTQSTDQTATQEWQRFDYTEAYSFVTWGLAGASVSETNDILFYGMQHEVGSYPTSYIKTSGSTVTRNQETYTKTGISDKINSEEGVLFAEISRTEDESNYRLLGLDNGTSQNYIKIGFGNNNGNFWIRALVNGVTVINSDNAVSNNANQFYKIAVRYKSGDSVIYIDGVPVLTSSTTFSSGTFTDLDFTHFTGSSHFFGKVKQLQIFKTALSDSELATLTT